MPEIKNPSAAITIDADGVATQLRAVIAPLARLLRQDAPEPFTATQRSVLGSIHRHGPLSLRELAKREQLSAPMISKVVSSLDAQGVITRLEDPADRRVCLVELSFRGHAWIDKERSRRNAWLATRLGNLPGDQLLAVAAAVPALQALVSSNE